MKEPKLLAAFLGVLLAGAYWSWSTDRKEVTEEKVTILGASPDEIDSLRLVTDTTTVTLTYTKDEKGERYPWFVAETRNGKRAFTGNEKTKELVGQMAPFKAIRSLGSSLSAEELKAAELDRVKRTLIIGAGSGQRVYELGGRTYGSRDHYLRAKGGSEVFLVENRVISDLELPESRFMERRVRAVKDEDVASVAISAGGKVVKVLHKNRLSDKDAFWASEAKPDERSESLENYLDKLDKLTVTKYGGESEPLPPAEAVFEVSWFDENDKVIEQLSVSRGKRPPPAEGQPEELVYVGRSNTTHVPAELSKSIAEQLEKDLSVVFGGP